MGLMLILCAVMLVARAWLAGQADPDPFQVVDVRGEVPHPGLHPVPLPVTVQSAVQAAGGSTDDVRRVQPGTRLVVDGEGIRIEPMDERLVFGLPIELNSASREALLSVPSIGPVRADAIIETREKVGPFVSVDELTRISGIGPATVDRIRPFVAVK